jgi:hypothetical protein
MTLRLGACFICGMMAGLPIGTFLGIKMLTRSICKKLTPRENEWLFSRLQRKK